MIEIVLYLIQGYVILGLVPTIAWMSLKKYYISSEFGLLTALIGLATIFMVVWICWPYFLYLYIRRGLRMIKKEINE